MAHTELPLGNLNPDCVEAVWCFRASGGGSQCVLPDGRMDLVAHCMVAPDGQVSSVWLAIAGPADAPSQIHMQAGMVSVGVRFRIGWGGSCLGVDPVALRNSVMVGKQAAQMLGHLPSACWAHAPCLSCKPHCGFVFAHTVGHCAVSARHDFAQIRHTTFFD